MGDWIVAYALEISPSAPTASPKNTRGKISRTIGQGTAALAISTYVQRR